MEEKSGAKRVKNQHKKINFYFSILEGLKTSTNLQNLKDKLNLSKQQLNYYLRNLKKSGFIHNKGYGWWELTEKGKNPTNHGIFFEKDSIRGHAYVWNVYLPKEIKGWEKRIEILKNKEINYKLVGTLKNVPRIKVLGRKIWLCNNHLRIYDIEKSSYYGGDANESIKNANMELFRILSSIENKLGISLKVCKFEVRKHHYALIKNDLAIDQNNKGIIMRIKDENNEEFLLIDDSLGLGGELETVGKKALEINIPLQRWWIKNKLDNFETTDPENIKKNFNEVKENLKESSEKQIDTSLVIKQLSSNLDGLTELVHQIVYVLSKDKKNDKKDY